MGKTKGPKQPAVRFGFILDEDETERGGAERRKRRKAGTYMLLLDCLLAFER